MGHPEPFNMKFIGVGNEQWDDLFFRRLEPFVAAIKAKYPNIQIVGTSGPDSEGAMFEKGWEAMKRLKADLVDEHFYRPESWFLGNAAGKEKYGEYCGALRYEHYDRKGPKVFAGEYACHGANGKKWNHYEASILEAAFMTDLERNADVVYMTAYAPLFAHVEGWQWRPDLIWYDNLRMFKSCSYYVQQMYAANKGTNVLKMTMDKQPIAGQEGQDGLFASAVFDANTGSVILKVINTSRQSQPVSIQLTGMKGSRTAETITLSHNGMDDENTLDRPDRITPQNGTLLLDAGKGATLLLDDIPPMTFRLYKVKK